ncbi:MAG: septum formation initiator family protein [Clostridia bacterium]|nr:septum formation initiator family protein [Clostridia bacterium]
MNMRYAQPRRSKRETAWNRVLLILAAAVLFVGLFMQITMLSRISSQSKQASALEREIVELSANAENLELSINQYHNLDAIEMRARQLGMEEPTDTQIRVVSVVQTESENTSIQAVELIDGEKVQN